MKTKRERFETIAAKRVQKIINDMNSLAKCANKNNYEYNDEDIKKMVKVLKQKIKNLEDFFFQHKNNNKNEFKF